ncbi:hypothetical protein EXIGLDRAFT_735980 [Exidia glandulosa HHB12029]|uniref:Uncharacterized protein n=1 Tax=Exidia glandulosa HHB12029 TaxID=1314781 RepID=A0A165JMV7_EXIGL|nr:hypothetical protein EXIGLDRAFT_735980 [Exidia glandulosa HHB12029]
MGVAHTLAPGLGARVRAHRYTTLDRHKDVLQDLRAGPLDRSRGPTVTSFGSRRPMRISAANSQSRHSRPRLLCVLHFRSLLSSRQVRFL